MRVKLLKSTVVDNKRVTAGDTIEASDQAGRFLISIGKAELAPEKAKAKEPAQKRKTKAVDTSEIVTR